MAIKNDTLKEARSALKSMSKARQKNLTKAELIASLITDIHEKMLAGFKLEEICEEINKTLDENDKISLNTFRTYVRNARQEAGIEPTRTWTRKSENPRNQNQKEESLEVKKEYKKKDINEGFRDQGGEL